MKISDITVPHSDVSDDVMIIVAWHVLDGAPVEAGKPLVDVGTSKAVLEVEAPTSGHVRILVPAGVDVKPGLCIGHVSESLEDLPELASAKTEGPSDQVKATQKARQLALEHGVDLSLIKAAGIITELDVNKVLAARPIKTPSATTGPAPSSLPAARSISLTPVQRAAAVAVKKSQNEAACAYLLGEADLTESLSALDRLVDDEGILITLTDWAIFRTAQVLRDFPKLNASLMGNEVRMYAEINIGVTVEVDEDLYLAILRQSDQMSLSQVAQKRQEMVNALFKRNIQSGMLAGGTFSVTVLDQEGLLHQLPIISPGQAGILGLGPARAVPGLSPDNALQFRKKVGLTVAYDHRFVNGAYASRFLQSVSKALAHPPTLQEIGI